VVVIDPITREVRAMVGGYGFRRGGWNRALQSRRQPGSAFKPFLYAAAFKSDQKITPATVLNDSPQIFEVSGFKDWKPKNAESHEFLGPVRLRTALARSLNTVAAQLIEKVLPHPVAELARACGIQSKLEETLALGLGASGVTLLELTNAYTTFAAQGRRQEPSLILSLQDKLEPRDPAVQAIEPEVAFLVTSLMQSVIEEGTAAAARGKLKRPAAGKTGTTTSERDAWFVGFTPDLVAGVWVGFDDLRDLGHGEQGARSALPVWVEVMNGALKGMPPSLFTQPAAIEVHKIDPVTGLLAAPGAPNAIDEYFLPGTAPAEVAPTVGEPNPDTFLIDQQ
jgi:penicillin-binding protein 1A